MVCAYADLRSSDSSRVAHFEAVSVGSVFAAYPSFDFSRQARHTFSSELQRYCEMRLPDP
jgi:hypothetical protein